MFITLKYGDITEFIAIETIARVEPLWNDEDGLPYCILFKAGDGKKIAQDIYEQVCVQLSQKCL